MENNKLKDLLKNAFDDFEEMPNESIFGKINTELQKNYQLEKRPINGRSVKYLTFLLAIIFVGLGGYYMNSNNLNKIIEKSNFAYDNKNTIIDVKTNFKNEEKQYTSNKINNSPIEEKSLTNSLNISNLKLNNSEKIKPNLISETNRIITLNDNLNIDNNSKTNNVESKRNYSFGNQNLDKLTLISGKSIENQSDKSIYALTNTRNFIQKEKLEIDFSKEKTKMNHFAENENMNNLQFISAKNIQKLTNSLAQKELPALLKHKTLKKDLPKINKTTPLAIELGINPFYGFQKIEPSAAGLENIQNISRSKVTGNERLGFSLNAGYIINWTKQSRLRLGLNYRDIFQKVAYEKATDVYEFQTINGNQTVLVRKGIPYSEEKRNQMIGIKADRQFFLQLSTPLRFYASLGAEYTKVLNSKSQMLFINSTMGIDYPISNKWRLQLEPSYSYAILGSTDANKFVNINPNHLGAKLGLVYDIRR